MSDRRAVLLAAALVVAVVALLAVETARGGGEREAVAAIGRAFGHGELGGCFSAIAYRESRYQARAANWTDRHSDGSRGSFGIFQLGALWRNRGESVAHFAARMFNPWQNARLARRIYDRYGTAPWGGC